MTSFELHPFDTLFFRDARPMMANAGSGGHGARWPLPTIVHEALRAALLQQAGLTGLTKTQPGHLRPAHHGRRPTIFTEAFRSLKTRGPFPARNGTLYLPCPADLAYCGERLEVLRPLAEGLSADAANYPAPWLRPVLAQGRPGKDKTPEWIPVGALQEYLSGRIPTLDTTPLFHQEHRIGIELDDETHTAKDGQLYSARHLRLAPGVSLWVSAALSTQKQAENHGIGVECLREEALRLGGEARTVRIKPSALSLSIKEPAPGRFIKWVLTTHAVFHGGWRPAWVRAEDGAVMLKAGDTRREPGEPRVKWRMRVRALDQNIEAKLVAIRAEKPVYFSGWDLGEQAPKPTLAAVPAGAVYYFEAANPDAGKALIAALHGRTRSDFLGEKGLGLGFCGTWTPADVAGRPLG